MDGYDVIASDDHKVGHVVGTIGDNLIVEHGTIFKSRHPLPRAFTEVHDDEQVVRATVSRQILESAPKVENGHVDEQAVAEHYGLAEAYDEPPTEGYGELTADDPAHTAEEDARDAGLGSVEQERARLLGHTAPGEGPFDSGSSPGATGGDRFRDSRA
jgi:hypothetical protein